jgi:hypothetical protein
MKKVTKGDVATFIQIANSFLNNTSHGKTSQFTYALDRMTKKLKNDYEDYLGDLEEKRIELAGKDKDGYVISENNEYKMTAESRKSFREFSKKIDSEEVEIEPYLAKELPKSVTWSVKNALTPFVVKEYDFDPEAEEVIELDEPHME